jgi:hypothetical protein
MLFIKSNKDQLIPSSQMSSLQSKATNASRHDELVIEEGGHNDNWSIDSDRYFGKIKAFMDDCQDF